MEPQEPKDFLDFFHQAASDHGKKVAAKPVAEHNEQVKGKILDILKKIKGNQKDMEALQQTNPKAYQSMLAMTQAMVQMAKQYMVQPEEPKAQGLEKAQHRLNIPSGTTKQGAAPIPKAGETGVVSQDEPNKDGQAGKKRHNRQVRSGLTTNPENGMPISVKEVPRQENDGAKPPKG
jgi:hypothetical protein